MPDRYSRDLHGYGQTPPDPKWPGNAKVVVQIVMNYEEGGENSILHGDEASEAFLTEVVGAQPWPGKRHWNIETMYEYGSRVGFWRLHRLFTQMNVPITVYGVTAALARGPAQVAAMQDAGWEIASHGLRWIEYKDFSADEERAHLQEAIRLHTEVTGERPRGWYTGRCTERTLDLIAEEGGFAWCADSYSDELPYWHHHAGHDQLVIPYSLDANDARFVGAPGFSHGQDFYTYLHDAFDTLYEEGHHGPARILSVGLHCRLAGRPGRLAGLKKFLEHVKRHEGVWIARRIDIAEHWARTHPPVAWDRPSQMDREAFVAKWGGIFEHSPWIAERAHELELGPAHDTAVGLHSALARAFRSASDDERLGVLRKHPDLAGKLAAAKRLTPESSAEQASAGLDMLTDAERAQFTDLNERYTAKFSFPFIIAVKDHDKAGILRAFETRLENDREAEFATACKQVERIAALRLKDLLP